MALGAHGIVAVPATGGGGPTTYVSDTFTRANGAIGTAETGGAWTNQGTTVWSVSSNKAKLTTHDASTNCDIVWIDPAVSDISISADFAYATASSCGLITRVTPFGASANMIAVLLGSGVLKLYHATAGSYTQAGSNGGTLTNGNTYNVKLTVSGNTHNVYLDGVLVIGPQTISAHAGDTKVGLVSFNDTTTTVDTFLVTS